MFCNNCYKEIEDTAQFCPYCGCKVEQQNKIKNNKESKPKKHKSGLGLAIGMLVTSLIVLILYISGERENIVTFHLGCTSGFFISGTILSCISIKNKWELTKSYVALALIAVSLILVVYTSF